MDAHLLLDIADRHAVARPNRAIVVHVELWHDEQRHALDALGAARDFRQHKVNDVVRHVVITGRDEDLLARNFVRAIVLRFSFGAHQAQIGAAMRLRQVHGAGPFAADHLGR